MDRLFPDAHTRLRQAAVVTGLGLAGAAPYLHYVSTVVPSSAAARAQVVDARAVLTVDVLFLLPLLVITSLVGCFLSERYRLGGIGSLVQLRESLPLILPAGAILGLLSYLLLGRRLAFQAPGLFPDTVGWALVMPLKSALLEETVARFGMMTVLAGLTRRPWAANLLQALFFSGLNLKGFAFFGIPPGPLVWASLGGSLVVNLGLGAAYARYGLAAAAVMHLVVDLRFVLHACLV